MFSKLLRKLDNIPLPFMLRYVHGHSMIPILPPGTLVWGLRWFKRLKVDDVIIFRHDGKEKIKRISDMRDDELFVLGDLQEESTDSRHFGWVPRREILAKVVKPKNRQGNSEKFISSET